MPAQAGRRRGSGQVAAGVRDGLGGGQREEGVPVLRVDPEAFPGDLLDHPDAARAGLRRTRSPRRLRGRRHGPGRGQRGRRRGRADPDPLVRELERHEVGGGGRILEVEHADFADDPVPAAAPLDLDHAVEGLVERREDGGGVHLVLQEEESGEVEAIELALRGLGERVDLAGLVHVHRGGEHLDERTPRTVSP